MKSTKKKMVVVVVEDFFLCSGIRGAQVHIPKGVQQHTMLLRQMNDFVRQEKEDGPAEGNGKRRHNGEPLGRP